MLATTVMSNFVVTGNVPDSQSLRLPSSKSSYLEPTKTHHKLASSRKNIASFAPPPPRLSICDSGTKSPILEVP